MTSTFTSVPCLAVAMALSVLACAPALAEQPERKPVAVQASEQQGGLTLQAAIARALKNAPVLQASTARASAAVAARRQAGALPNPEFSLEAENIMGDGPYDGFDNADITYGVSQLVELPGKRGNRIKIADADSTKGHLSGDATRLDLIRDVTITYVQLLAAQQEVSIREEETGLTNAVLSSVAARVEAGKEPAIQRNKAKIAQTSSQIALDRARRTMQAQKQALASLMGGGALDFAVVADSLPRIEEPQALELYATRMGSALDIQGFDAEVKRAEAAVSFEKAAAVPDPTLTLGVRDIRGDDSQAFIAGVSFPIPVFDRNRGNIHRAGQELTAAVSDRHAAELSLAATLAQLHGNLMNAYSEANTLQTSVIDGAQEAFSFAKQGYEAGKFGYLEVLDAQRTLFETRQQLNTAIVDYHTQRAQIERLTAVHDDGAKIKE